MKSKENWIGKIFIKRTNELINSIETQVECLKSDVAVLKKKHTNEPEKLKWRISELVNIEKLLDGAEAVFFNFITIIDRGG